MSHKPVLKQVVGFVDNGEQEISGLSIAAHKHISFACSDHIYCILNDIDIVGNRLQIEGPVFQTQGFQLIHYSLVIADQNRLGKTRFLCIKKTQKNVLHICSGQSNTGRPLKR